MFRFVGVCRGACRAYYARVVVARFAARGFRYVFVRSSGVGFFVVVASFGVVRVECCVGRKVGSDGGCCVRRVVGF